MKIKVIVILLILFVSLSSVVVNANIIKKNNLSLELNESITDEFFIETDLLPGTHYFQDY